MINSSLLWKHVGYYLSLRRIHSNITSGWVPVCIPPHNNHPDETHYSAGRGGKGFPVSFHLRRGMRPRPPTASASIDVTGGRTGPCDSDDAACDCDIDISFVLPPPPTASVSPPGARVVCSSAGGEYDGAGWSDAAVSPAAWPAASPGYGILCSSLVLGSSPRGAYGGGIVAISIS